jgi:hypothetical protein
VGYVLGEVCILSIVCLSDGFYVLNKGSAIDAVSVLDIFRTWYEGCLLGGGSVLGDNYILDEVGVLCNLYVVCILYRDCILYGSCSTGGICILVYVLGGWCVVIYTIGVYVRYACISYVSFDIIGYFVCN